MTAGTIFEGSHLPLRVWFRAIWWVTNQKNGVSALGLQRLLGLGSYKTAWMCLHKLRRAMVRPNRELLGGRIELDETFVGGVKRGTSSSTTKAAVAIAAEIRGDGTGRIRLKRLPRNIEPCVVDFVQANIAAGSEILTDGANNYRRLRLYGYKHTGTSLIAKGREASNAVIPRVHRVASLLKRWLLGAHQGRVSTEQLDHYLAEFAFRFNRRASPQRGMLFYRLLQQAVVQKPSPYKVITREVERTV